MPGGYKNIKPSDNKKPFTSERQPDPSVVGRKSTKFLTAMIETELQGPREVIVEGISLETGKPHKVRVPMPTHQTIVRSLLRQAAKGNLLAIKEVFDRVEGKAPQPVDLDTTMDFNVTIID